MHTDILCVTIQQRDLLADLSVVTRISQPKSLLPALGHVLIGASDGGDDSDVPYLSFSTTSLESGLTLTRRSDITVFGTHRLSVPAHLLLDFVRNVGDCVIELRAEGDNRLCVTAGDYTATFATTDADSFPQWAIITDASTPLTTCRADNLISAIERVGFAAAHGSVADARHMLSGIQLDFAGDWLTLAASDGIRLATTTAPLITPARAACRPVVAATALDDLRAVLALDTDEEVAIYAPAPHYAPHDPTCLIFGGRRFQYTVTLLSGSYPNWQALIPTHESVRTRVRVAKDEVVRALRVSSLFAGGTHLHPITLDIGRAVLCLRASDGLVGDSQNWCEAEIAGEAVALRLDQKPFSQAITAICQDSEQVEIGIVGLNAPVLITPVGPHHRSACVMMPIASLTPQPAHDISTQSTQEGN